MSKLEITTFPVKAVNSMGRRNRFPKVVFLPIINEGEKLTEEQKAWLLGKNKTDSTQGNYRLNGKSYSQSDFTIKAEK